MKKIIIVSVAIAAIGVAALLSIRSSSSGEGGEASASATSSSGIRDRKHGRGAVKRLSKKQRLPMKKKGVKSKSRLRRSQNWGLEDFDDDEHPYSTADKKAALELQVAEDALDEYDEDDFKPLPEGAVRSSRRLAAEAAQERFYKAVQVAMKSMNPAVRRACVDTCAWRGAEALPELTGLLADVDPTVSEAAMDAVQTALDDMESPTLQFQTAAAYLQTFAGNEDARDVFSSTLTSAASDLIDAVDDSAAAEAVARGNREQVVTTLADMIESGSGNLATAVKEAYQDITTEEWVSRDEALKWAQDPDNYEAPEVP